VTWWVELRASQDGRCSVTFITWILRVSAYSLWRFSLCLELPLHFQVFWISYLVDSVNLTNILEVIATLFVVAVKDTLCRRIVMWLFWINARARNFVRSQLCRRRMVPNDSPPYWFVRHGQQNYDLAWQRVTSKRHLFLSFSHSHILGRYFINIASTLKWRMLQNVWTCIWGHPVRI
jgi:hypothetical protein